MWYLVFMFCMATADQCAMPNDKIDFQIRVYRDSFPSEAACEAKAMELLAGVRPQPNVTISHECLNPDDDSKD
jgi:hypothetical protein